MTAVTRAALRAAIVDTTRALDGPRGRTTTSAVVLTLQTAVTIAAAAALPSWLMGDRRAVAVQREEVIAAAQQLCIVWVVAAVGLASLLMAQAGGGWRPRWCLAASGRLLLMLVSLTLPIGWWFAAALVFVHLMRYVARVAGFSAMSPNPHVAAVAA